MRRINPLKLLLAGLLIGPTIVALAQSYDLSWHVIAGGGGTSAGTNGSTVYSLSGTIGQHDAGTMSGTSSAGSYTLAGGFWGIFSVVQTPGSPLLTISAAPNNHVVLSWTASAAGFVLQQDSALGNTNWAIVNTNTFPLVVTNGSNTVTLPLGSNNEFFRLVNP